jgi:hypothetical protein
MMHRHMTLVTSPLVLFEEAAGSLEKSVGPRSWVCSKLCQLCDLE